MRISKISAGNSDYRIWVLGFAVSVIALMAVWQSWFNDEVSIPSNEDFQVTVTSNIIPSKGHGFPPVLAYWICGTKGDGKRMLRLLKAIYHPRNQYLLQLDADSFDYERAELLVSIQSETLFRAFGNVNVVGRNYGINKVGSSALAAILHAAALFLKLNKDWDWFINLSPVDYPLMTQDDLLHAIGSLPKDLNFIKYHSSQSEWKERRSVDQIVIDPSLYLEKSSDLFYTVERRRPDAFKIYGGSPWVILTRGIMEYCVQGWDNLPRKLVMYFSNVAYPIESYFHTVLCNSPELKNKTINTDLSYNVAEESDYEKIVVSSGEAAFARPFKEGDLVLNKIDNDILNRPLNGVVPGNWCLGQAITMNYTEEKKTTESWNLCETWGNVDAVKPGTSGVNLAVFLSNLQIDANSHCHPE
ncbi:hypothetical protein JCGZ_26346 [Jatropha curcas]|uniref:Uncharacterized protein n=1 Tax=Jatropha curcas TaxID=180498 RepID=A0A067JR87_JATCU|nr:beta-glucuronosyltransferase GlcAT14A [Jatropha curcas]KDP22515.1 hypothetical protein JCGZ_26346 [Jatropha curcas]